jgi:hypothetical protein
MENAMRMQLQILLPAALAATALVACDIPDDGFAELKGEIHIPAALASLVVMPADDDSDCTGEPSTWGENPVIGDTTPTVYVGLYKKPLDPLNDNFNPTQETAWFNSCGEIDEDDDPVTPPIHHDEACPIGGTTATYVKTISGSNGGPVFEFEALQLETGTAYLIAWLDNKCAEDNDPTTNLVWQIGGAPGPLDSEGEEEATDENDLANYPALEVDIGSGGNSIDPIVLNSALSASML